MQDWEPAGPSFKAACSFPKLTWMPCTAHIIDLFLEDIGKQEWAGELFTWAKGIVKFIKAHHKSLAIFRNKSQLELTQAGDPDCLQSLPATTIMCSSSFALMQLQHALAPIFMHLSAWWCAKMHWRRLWCLQSLKTGYVLAIKVSDALLCQLMQRSHAELKAIIFDTDLELGGELCQEAVMHRHMFKRAKQLVDTVE